MLLYSLNWWHSSCKFEVLINYILFRTNKQIYPGFGCLLFWGECLCHFNDTFQGKKQCWHETTLFISLNLRRLKNQWQDTGRGFWAAQHDNLDIHFQNQGQTFFPSSLTAFTFRRYALDINSFSLQTNSFSFWFCKVTPDNRYPDL